jgi:hypothetical protein
MSTELPVFCLRQPWCPLWACLDGAPGVNTGESKKIAAETDASKQVEAST